jgi:histidinol phosphatase-like PHP family hydrolase
MVNITSDWHIHSRNSCDAASMVVADLVRGAAETGILDYGLTDHLHTSYNMPDIAASRAEYAACDPSPRFHFGIEVSCVSQWELDQVEAGNYDSDKPPTYGLRQGGPAWAQPAIALTGEDVERYQIEFVVGGTHWPLYVPIEGDAVRRDYHRQNMFLAQHPLVDIVAHPWWWHGAWMEEDGHYRGEPWLDDFAKIPWSMHDEFAAAVVENEKVVEINLAAMLLNRTYPETFKGQYLSYLAELKARGVRLSIGSDCHSPQYDTDMQAAARMLESVGIGEADLWRLPLRDAD